MAPLKAPGSDGFHALFFHKQWDTIKGAVCDWVMENLEEFCQFQPIRRNINENIILAQERKWMAIKINLEKAYDRVSWEFIDASLRVAGIPSILLMLLCHLSVMWNGVLLSKFRPVRGIRQGCPLFLYLFVLCMEWLGHLIQYAISEGKRNPIRLSRDGPDISHLFFADGLVIFSKADSKHCRILKDILDRFCTLSGQKINARKTNIFFSKCMDESSRVYNLGQYLGVLIFHQRVTSSTLQFVVEKVRGMLQSWETKKLTLTGRITLAQSVHLSIPSYFIQSMMKPRKTRDEIESLVKKFI
ncbi:LINE-1 reverse transcriptase isogeny [Gossypium australe]|uniref:LINE-1 reverse transcriptase isogeny n=1 Tax=Gossypium australe TaxID=47621 RepID=A0A5B6X6Q5_9ROSI|nr:LINE-1 reverse transcriptase isogeny [Gossypium australe]